MKIFFLFVIAIFFLTNASAQSSFKIIPLGVKGGADESNLSAYLVANAGSDAYICLDAGTINAGLKKAIASHALAGRTEDILRNNIKGYLISHGHLDHVAGLVLNSPDDSNKNIYVMPYVKKVLEEKYFTSGSWINFTDEGEKPLNKYHYQLLDSAKEIPLAQTQMFVTAFPLSHGAGYKSTAFLIRHGDEYLLYLGDTGADATEHSNNLHVLWQYIAGLLKTKKLKAIFIECSYPDAQPENKLFGHLTPRLLMKEISDLAMITGAAAVKNLPLVITHIKPGGTHEVEIQKELAAQNVGRTKLIFAKQGKAIQF